MGEACAKAGDCQQAQDLFQEMRRCGITPNVVSYASLARPYAHQGNWQEVESLAETMKSEGLAMNEYFLYAMLLAYASAQPRQVQRAEAAFREACLGGIKM